MRFKGKKVLPPKPTVVILPRNQEDSEDLVFMCQAVLSFDEFDKLVPEPTAPFKTKPGEQPVPDFDSPKYIAEKAKYNLLRYDWYVLMSLSATSELEWETVSYNQPDTWANWRKELESSGCTNTEINRILSGIAEANGTIDEEKMKEARARFFRTQVEQARS